MPKVRIVIEYHEGVNVSFHEIENKLRLAFTFKKLDEMLGTSESVDADVLRRFEVVTELKPLS